MRCKHDYNLPEDETAPIFNIVLSLSPPLTAETGLHWPQDQGWLVPTLYPLSSTPQVLVILTALQPSIFSILANGGQIACSPPFSSKIRSQGKHLGLLSTSQARLGVGRGDRTLGQKWASLMSAQNVQEESKKAGRGSEDSCLSDHRELQCPQLEASPNDQTRRPGVQSSTWDKNGYG